jgi:hypothetical protein
MGGWGVKLYQSDEALDLKGSFGDLKRFPGTTAELIASIVKSHPELRDPASEAHSDLWLILADQLHAHGLNDPETSARVRGIVESGADIAVKRELEMSERDLTKRQTELEALLAKWAVPAAKPKPRNIYKAPQPQVFAPGDIVAYPTSRGNPGNPWYPALEREHGWVHDGWGSFVVLHCGHMMGFVAWQVIGRLSVHGKARPDFAACAASGIENQPWWQNLSGKGELAVQLGAAYPPKHVKKRRLELLGRVALDPAKVAVAVPLVGASPRGYLAEPDSVLAWWTKFPKPVATVMLRDLAV